MRKWAGIVTALLLMITVASLSLWWPPRLVEASLNTEITSSTSDGDITAAHGVWNTVWSAASGDTKYPSSATVLVRSDLDILPEPDLYRIDRGFLYFNTSTLADDCYITSAELHFYVTDIANDDGIWLILQSDTGLTYPTDPLVLADYDRTKYDDTILGLVDVSTLTDDAWNTISLTATGISRIQKAGWTNYVMRTDYDTDNWTPTGLNEVQFSSADAGSNHPHLSIDYVNMPVVTSQAASSVATTTATGNGNITDTGGENNDYRGIAYGKTSKADPGNVSPVTTNPYDTYVIAGPGSYGTGAFTGSLVGLDTNTDYYYRSFTHNTAGWDWSADEQSFHTLELPAITIGAASSITNTTATLPGDITDAGYPNPTVTVYWGDDDAGVVAGSWDFNSAPTTPAQPQGLAAFSKNITGLAPGVTYYFRAAATNTAGTVWAAATLNFATSNVFPTVTTGAASAVINVSATLNGNITNTGGDPTCDYRGFAWDNVTHGAPGDVVPAACGYDGPPLIGGLGYYSDPGGPWGTGAFTYSLTTLTQNTIYYYRAFTHNSSGWAYGDEVTFTTEGVPTCTTQAATDVHSTTAILNGTAVAENGDTVTRRGFEWGLTVAYGSSTDAAGGLGAFSKLDLAGLTPGTLYHYRAGALNGYGVGWGADMTFTTLPEPPTNLNAYEITYTTVSLSWTAGAHAQKSMLRYGLSDYPATPGSGTEAYNNTGTSVTVDSLTPGQGYYFRVWSWVSGSDVWSDGYSQTYIVLPINPPVSLKAKAIDSHTINLWWLVPDNVTAVANIYTIIMTAIGDYPTDPPDPGDTEVYNELTGDEGVKNYVWTDADPGTPYFFGIWFYNSLTGLYTTPEYAVTTTPAGFGSTTYPGGSGYFEDPDATGLVDNPIDPIVEAGATQWGFEHGMMWAFLVMVCVVLLGMGLAIYSKSGLITTFGMTAVMVSAGIADVLPYWLCIPFVLLGIALSWSASHSYG